MLASSPRDRSRSPHSTDDTSTVKQLHHSNQNEASNEKESTDNSKVKKENESQQRIKNLKSFIQTLINESKTIDSTYNEQMKTLEKACVEEYHDLSIDRIRRMIRSALKLRKSQPSSSLAPSHTTSSSFLHKDHTNIVPITNGRFNSNENNNKKSRSNSVSNNPTTKTTDLVSSSSTLSALDADFLRHAFSQQFRPSSLDLSAYFSAAATASNGTNSASSLFRPNFSPSNFLQSLTNTTSLAPPPPPPPPIFVSSHTHTNGTSDSSSVKSSKQAKLSSTETNSIKLLVNAYREAASYLCRSADELEQLI